MDVEEELEELEKDFEKTQEEFESLKNEEQGPPSDKEEKAEQLIQEIRGQLEFLHEQMKNDTEDF